MARPVSIFRLFSIILLSVGIPSLLYHLFAFQAEYGQLEDFKHTCFRFDEEKYRTSNEEKRPYLSDLMGIMMWDDVVCLLLEFFRVLLDTWLGKGVTLALLSCAIPLASMQSLEAGSPSRSKLLGVWTIFTVTSVGQLLGIGIATPVFWLPLAYTIARWRGPRLLSTPSVPSPSYRLLSMITGFAICVATVTMVFWPIYHTGMEGKGLGEGGVRDDWIWVNLTFQYFPLFYLPILLFNLLLPPSELSSSSLSAIPSQQEVSSTLQGIKLENSIAAVIWWVGTGMALWGWVFRGERGDDANHFLTIDAIGMLTAVASVYLIEHFAFLSPAGPSKTNKSKARNDIPEREVSIRVGNLLLGGPGYAFGEWVKEVREKGWERGSAQKRK